ncbi:14357_t:CDS:2, partial [Dentiscutata erythropus]
KYDGIVKLFSENEDNKKTDKGSRNMDKNTNEDNYQNIDKYFLVILNGYGIHKHHFKHLNKPTGKIQSFYYPKRIRKTLKYNEFSAKLNLKYILRCLNKHYFLVDTTNEGAQYMELYNLKTNQLVNTFKRRNLNSLKNDILDISDNFAISNNNKLLAYKSGKQVKLYLTECGLEIASINVETDKSFYDYFMHFFNNDERLLIYQSKNNGLFGIFSVQSKSQLNSKINLRLILKFQIIRIQNEKSDEQDLKTLSLEKNSADIDNNKFFIFNLDNQKLDLDRNYYIIEPWARRLEKEGPRYSVYLDNEKEVLLLIGSDTIQVWHDRAKDKNDQAKKRTLEFIKACRTLKFLNDNVDNYFSLSDENRYSKFQKIIKQTRNIIVRFIQLYPVTWRLLDIRYDLLSILNKAEEYQLIKYVLFEEKTDIVYSKKRILKTLDYLVSKLENIGKNEDSHDIKPDQDILLHEKSLRMPQKSSWEDKEKAKNSLNKALS